jgi:flagellar hook-associated protein 2
MASTVNFSGLGSGLDFTAIRDAIIAQRQLPVNQIQTKVNSYNNRIVALKGLNTVLASLTTASAALTDRSLGGGRSGTAVNDAVATITASSSANLGNFNLNVTRLATSLTQSSRAYGSATAPILAGGAAGATFELRTGGAATGTEITIDSSNNTLAGMRDAINNANAGVTATIVDITGDGTQQELVLSSNETGASGRVELVETSATGTLADMNLATVNPGDGDFSKLDASFSVNGINLTRSSNTVSNAVAGVTLTLRSTGTTAVNITQSADIENKLKDFITAYNAIQDVVAQNYNKDAAGRPTGILAGDPTLRAVQQQLRSALNIISDANGGPLTSLSDIGVTVGSDGKLALDSDVLNEKLQTNSDDVRALLYGATSGNSGLFTAINEISSGMSDTVTGSVQSSITGYQSSVKSMNDSISRKMEALTRLRDSLTKQFAAVDAAIGQLNSQGTTLTSIMASLNSNK